MKNSMNAEIIAVGTELLLGQISNTNAQWLSERLAISGINVFHHGVVGDNLYRVEEIFSQAQNRSDVIIVTGGLGPTEDDMTREAFQRISGMELMEHQSTMDKIISYFAATNTAMTPNNRKQARVFKYAQILENNVGMAPGMIVNHEEKIWIFLPGVPKEMKHLAEKDVLPYLRKTAGTDGLIKSTVLKFAGIGESALEDSLSELIHSQSNPTIAPLAQDAGVVLRLTAKAGNAEEADQLLQNTKQTILQKVGGYFYGTDTDTIEGQIISRLRQQGKKIAAAESLTGGMFTERLVSVEGASEVLSGGIVSYQAGVKQEVLGVSSQTIEQHGTVSKECALEMAKRIRELLNTSVGISFTGVAGPGEIEEKPAGTVYIAISDSDNGDQVKLFTFQGSRNSIRERACKKGLEILFKHLK